MSRITFNPIPLVAGQPATVCFDFSGLDDAVKKMDLVVHYPESNEPVEPCIIQRGDTDDEPVCHSFTPPWFEPEGGSPVARGQTADPLELAEAPIVQPAE